MISQELDKVQRAIITIHRDLKELHKENTELYEALCNNTDSHQI
jgi:hypothetical protein